MIISKKKKLKQIIDQAQKQNKKVLIKKGVFDIIHPGHIYSIRQFKKSADIVIIFIQSGFLTRKEKGEKKPVNSSRQRAEVINGIKNVDYVYIDKSKSMEESLSLLEYLKPDIIAIVKKRKTKKYDRPYWDLKEFPDKNKRIFSTSNIINKIIKKIS